MTDTAAAEVQVVAPRPSGAPVQLTGRRRIYTDLTVDECEDEGALVADLERALDIHWMNAREIRYLQDYYLGVHPAIRDRVKRVRPDVDNKVIVDYAYSFTRDITGYFLGKSVRYVHRGVPDERGDDTPEENDNGIPADKGADKDESTFDRGRREVERLNHIYDIENKGLVDLQVSTDMSVTGIAYKGVFPEEHPRNGTHVHLRRLDPETTFVVYSAGDVSEPMYAVSYWRNNPVDITEAKTFVNVYTQRSQRRYVIDGDLVSFGVLNANALEHIEGPTPIDMGGYLPVVEYDNNAWRLGDWEVAVTLMDAIDTLASDGVNDIEQFVQNVLVAVGMEFTEATQQTLNEVGVLNIPQLPPGMEFAPEIRYITQQLDATSGESMRQYLEDTLRVIVGVPDRKTRGGGGGDTGDAVFLRDGWQDIDLVAMNKEPFFVMAERESLAVALYILKTFDEIGDLEASDIEIKFNRNKTSNIQSKAQVLQILWNMLDHADALEMSDLTTNVQDVILRAENAQEKRLQNQLEEQRRVSEVAAEFDNAASDDQQVNTGSQKKETVDE